MPGVSRISQDAAGGTLIGVLAPTVVVNGSPVAVLDCAVEGHGLVPHAAPVMAEASGTVFAGGIPLCRTGDAASCGHLATGSTNVFAGD
ncbi:PAAR domain-containing protein [Pseudophaeobacter arcticus]|uniref:PAAR domain-containing protein n=1 Tax=Pseudophaeobacter arcticus TaxID=385492 RepID=UPI00040EDBF3|nr:PAAR domain-containing protein [Pseudophaeobacter arcticus]